MHERDIPAKNLETYIILIEYDLYQKLTIKVPNDAALKRQAHFSNFNGPKLSCKKPIIPDKQSIKVTPLSMLPENKIRNTHC